MRSNLENSLLYRPRLIAAAQSYMRLALTGSFIVPADGPTLYFLDPGASARTVFLPSITSAAGQQYWIANLSSTKALNVVDADGVAVVTVPASAIAMFISYRSGWRSELGATDLINEIVLWTTQTVTAATGIVVSTDSEIYVNRAGVVTLTLPDVETWYAAHDMLTSHLLIKDVSGAAGTNNITINRAGADAIEGGTSLSITSDWGGWKLRRVKAATWGIVG